MIPWHPLVLITSSLAALVSAAAVQPRGTVDSDKLVGFSETVPAGTAGSVYKAYKPLLYVSNGCVPFPAVDAAGNTNGGLKPTGSTNGGCSKSTGQVYVRGAASRGMYALMYSWYMPKDSGFSGLGHRHDFEGCIVWLKSATSTSAADILAVCPSQHGDWACAKPGGFTLSGTQPRVMYDSVAVLDHALFQTTTVGGSQPMIAWESLPVAARNALQTTDFGSANVPFKDGAFEGNLDRAIF